MPLTVELGMVPNFKFEALTLFIALTLSNRQFPSKWKLDMRADEELRNFLKC